MEAKCSHIIYTVHGEIKLQNSIMEEMNYPAYTL